MSRWDALRPERRDEVKARSTTSARQRQPRASTSLLPQTDKSTRALGSSLTGPPVLHSPNQYDSLSIDESLKQFFQVLQQQKSPSSSSLGEVADGLFETSSHVNTTTHTLVSSTLPNGLDSRLFHGVMLILLESKFVTLSPRQLESCLTILQQGMDRDHTIFCVAHWIRSVDGRYFPAEQTAHSVVGGLFLPFLENDTTRTILTTSTRDLVLQAMQVLLNESHHASALLTPLTLDVTPQGDEQTLRNPWRVRILGVLQHHLPYSCDCLTVVLAWQPSSNSSSQAQIQPLSVAELDTSILESFLHRALLSCSSMSQQQQQQHRPLQIQALHLLRAILKYSPHISASLAAKLLLSSDGCYGTDSATDDNNGLVALPCVCRISSPLIHLVHATKCWNDDDDSNSKLPLLAIQCTIDMLHTLPLLLWLGGGKRLQRKSASHPPLGHLGQRMADALINLIQVVRCILTRCLATDSGAAVSAPTTLNTAPTAPSTRMDHVIPLATTLLLQVPYNDDIKQDGVCRAAVELVSTLGSIVMSLHSQHLSGLIDCFLECTGGLPRPQGGYTLMAIPVRVWLANQASEPFRMFLWDSLDTKTLQEQTMRRTTCHKLLCAVLRSMPVVVLGSPVSWERFQHTVHECIKYPASRLEGVLLIEKLLIGRQDSTILDESQISVSLFVSSMLFITITDHKPAIRIASVNSYGALLTRDWCELSQQRDGRDKSSWLTTSFSALLRCATIKDGEVHANTRAAACKSIGDACIQCLSLDSHPNGTYQVVDFLSDVHAKAICLDVSDVILRALSDSNASVRSMALFAVGNLAYAVRERRPRQLFMSPESLRTFLVAVSSCLHDTNDKVTGNAIRTIGHVGYLVFHDPYRDLVCRDDDVNMSLHYNDALRSLKGKVDNALAETTDAFTLLSWKQRSVAKKHGWGACNSLALLLDCEDAMNEPNFEMARDSVCALLRCVENAHVLNEKVSTAAMVALRKISSTRLSRLSDGSGMVGTALSSCLVRVYEKMKLHRSAGGKLESETELLLEHLLAAATIFDMCCLLKREEISKAVLEYLYEWMIDKEMDADTFESLALALQRRDLSNDIALEQKFASRALQRYRQQQILVCHGDNKDIKGDLMLNNNIDDDEL